MIDGVGSYFEPGWELWRWTEEQDDYGGITEQWTKQADIDGRMRPLTGDKRLSADKDTFFGSHRFYTKRADIKEGDQLRKDKDYEVKFVADIMQFGELVQVDCVVIE